MRTVRVRCPSTSRIRAHAFTLIELLVVIAIIALLIGIILPSLSQARMQGQALKCGANLSDVAKAMAGYLADWNGVYPPAYVYPKDSNGNYDFYEQDPAHPYGYIHWSWFLYGGGQVDPKSFQCPTYVNGGSPRTNPGPNDSFWESGQTDQTGSGAPGTIEDAQAPRMAYAGNAGVFPRNKYTTALSGGLRVNIFTQETKIGDTARIILITEYNNNWQTTANQEGGGLLSKSHRSINPFFNIGYGSDEYAAPEQTPGFTYGTAPSYGIMPKSEADRSVGLLDTPGTPETNVVGRHHPGGDALSGGAANFLYADGHVERKGIVQTLANKEWGLKYYAISGVNDIVDARQ